MPIQFRCGHCQASLKAPSAKAGARARCKKCSQIVTVPNPNQTVQRIQPSAANIASSPPPPATKAPQSESGFEPDFGSLTTDLPSFLAGQQDQPGDLGVDASRVSASTDPFADLPEFQSIDAAIEKSTRADVDFHRMMMSDSDHSQFVPSPIGPPKSGQLEQRHTDTTGPAPDQSAPDHSDIADVLNSLDTTITSAVQKQQQENERAVRAKFSVAQVKSAFAKPLGAVERLKGLRRKQIQSSIAVALVPLGFVAFVFCSTFGLLLLYRSWMYGNSEGVLHPVIGLSFVLFTIFIIGCWVPTVSLLFAAWHLLFGNSDSNESSTQLTRESQPVMYEFVDQICDKLGAPKPCRIDLDCEFNATASLRRGWLGSGKNDLVLTIGIPFIAIQNTEQLASVIAHEFGHFRQGSAMKTYYVIGSLTNWFMMTAQSGLSYFAWFGYLTHTLSGSLSREMEWDADRHAIQLAGSKAFEESSALLERFGVAYAVTIDNLVMLFQSGILVDNVPRFMMHIGRTMPASVVRRIAEETEQRRLDRLDSHPPTRDRVKAARAQNQPGILSMKRPATDLIDHWTPLCKKITLDFYAENLGFPRSEINESHVTPLDQLLRDEHKLLLDKAEQK